MVKEKKKRVCLVVVEGGLVVRDSSVWMVVGLNLIVLWVWVCLWELDRGFDLIILCCECKYVWCEICVWVLRELGVVFLVLVYCKVLSLVWYVL